MASSRSGSKQVLKVAPVNGSLVTIAQPGDDSGFEGLNLAYAASTFENASGGLTTTHNAGQVVVSGDFSIAESEVTIPLLHGANGQRFDVEWNSGSATHTFEAIFTISRTFNDRGKVMYDVAMAVDGAISVA